MTCWTDDRVETLKSLWQDGLSASQIAHALGNVTRNAVIGKVHRLGLSGRNGSPRVSRPRAPVALRYCAPARFTAVVTVIEQDPFRFEDGSLATMRTIDKAMCRWPIGDPMAGEFHFCGCAAKSGSPYCEAHAQRAHQPHRKRRAMAQPVGRFA